MKKFLFLLTLITSLAALPPLASAKDHDKDRDKSHDKDRDDDRDKKDWKQLRDAVREMREQYGRLSDSASRGPASRHLRDQIDALGSDVQRTSGQYEHGGGDPRDLRDRVARLTDSVNRTLQQLDAERAQRSRYDSRYDRYPR